MSYLVLARKCRPQEFDSVVAQRHITDTLKSAVSKERLAHAYLFCGPRGTGKTTTARILAKALNCRSTDKPTPEPCGVCDSCSAIAAGRDPDVLEIDGASNRGIAEIQALRERVQYAPRGRYKVFIIDEVHMLTKEAFNALLKTLEEPPPNVAFIFATTEPNKLPATIMSRCQRFDFRRIPASAISEQVKMVAENEGLTLTSSAAALIAHRADGGLRDALSLLDQILAYSPKGEISEEDLARILGILPIDAFRNIARNIIERNPAGALTELDNLLETGLDLAQVAEGLSEHFHGALMAKLGSISNDISEKTRETYIELSDAMKLEDLLRIAKLTAEFWQKAKNASQPRLLFEELLVYLSSFDRVADLAAYLTSSPAPARRMPPKHLIVEREELHEEPIEIHDVPADDNFAKIIEIFGSIKGEGRAEILRHATMIPDEGRIVLRFPHSFDYQVGTLLMKKEYIDVLEEAAEKVFGEKTDIKLIVESQPTAETIKEPSDAIPKSVANILEAFDAKLEN